MDTIIHAVGHWDGWQWLGAVGLVALAAGVLWIAVTAWSERKGR